MSIAGELAEFSSKLRYGDLPRLVIDRAKYLALDFVGVAARGSLADSSLAVCDVIQETGCQAGSSTVIATGLKAPCQYAALANGTAAHSLELDDLHNASSVHPGVVVFPAAFAVSELCEASGKQFIEAVVLGYEIMTRLGMAQNPANPYARGFYPTSICGVFGAALAAAKILNIDAGKMRSALGIAGSQASGIMEFLADGTLTHRLHSGWAAQSGVIAALLAKKGFTGPSTVIEGKCGFLRCYSDGPDLSRVLSGLGEQYEVMKVSTKSYSCCRYEHGPIDGILQIMKQHNLKAAEIEKVTIGVLKAGWDIIAEPVELKRNPRTVIDAIGSMPFGAAVAILYGDASVEEHREENLSSSKVKELMRRVYCVQDTALEKSFPECWPATVEIGTKDGKIFFVKVENPKGDYKNPLSWDELVTKYHTLSSPIYPDIRRKEILARLRDLEKEKNMAEFSALLLNN
ncbi:MAG: MmgE/PrpD family protein [Chloroflexi bacterium]|nr:MmgE/PrpD family protein [Chloroflexota bacterium]